MTPAVDDQAGRSEEQEVVTGAEQDLLSRAYAAYNRQDVDGLLAFVGDDVDWPDGSSRLRGKAAVGAYWSEQWTRTHTHDEPVAFSRWPDGRVAVRIDQVVRSLDGSPLTRGSFDHVFRIGGSYIVRLDITDARERLSDDVDELADRGTRGARAQPPGPGQNRSRDQTLPRALHRPPALPTARITAATA